MIQIRKAQALAIQRYLIDRFGGAIGLRDEGLLESALEAPFQTFDQVPLYNIVASRAAKLAQGLITNHPFVDGNKRLGVTVMGIYLELEGLHLTASNEELVAFGLSIAQHPNLEEI